VFADAQRLSLDCRKCGPAKWAERQSHNEGDGESTSANDVDKQTEIGMFLYSCRDEDGVQYLIFF
jgi:hypothetical protein